MKNISQIIFVIILFSIIAITNQNLVLASNENLTLISISNEGEAGNGDSFNGVISSDGKYITFASLAINFVAEDKDFDSDVFLYDIENESTDLVSVSIDGSPGNGPSSNPSISGDGRFVAFSSRADNLVSDDNNGVSDIFVFDREQNEIQRVSIGNIGEANGHSYDPSISADGKFVVFFSDATNLTSDSNGNIFVHDIEKGKTTSLGVYGYCSFCTNIISQEGQHVVFISDESGLVNSATSENGDIFLFDVEQKTTSYISSPIDGDQTNQFSDLPSISSSGEYIAFNSEAPNLVLDDENNSGPSIFWHNISDGITKLVSINSNGDQITPTDLRSFVNENGQIIAFSNNNIIYVHNVVTGKTIEFSEKGELTSMSSDGNILVFQTSNNLVDSDTNESLDVYLLKLSTQSVADQIPSPSSELTPEQEQKESKIPDWVRNNAGWWSQGMIEDSDFISGIQYLIQNDIMIIPSSEEAEQGEETQEIPEWIKNNAGWWADGLIEDSDFVSGIQYLISNGIMKV